MSWDTQAWAGKARPGTASEKLVLLGLAQCSDANHCAHPSVDWLCEFSDLNRKTVIAAIDRLEEKDLIRDTGRRVGRTGQVKVYRLGAGKMADPESNSPKIGTVPKSERFQNRNSSDFSSKESQKRDTEPVLEPNTPLEPDGSKPPHGGDEGGKSKNKGQRIPSDWKPPAIADLPPAAKAKAQQWPTGAYEAQAEAHLHYWLGETGPRSRKLDWDRAWFNRINTVTAQVLRDAKAGVQYAPTAATRADAPPPAALDTSRETQPAKAIRGHLARRLGESTMTQWFSGSRLDVSEGTLTIVAPSLFASTYQRDNFADDAGRAMHAVLGPDADLQWRVEKPPAA